MTEKVKLPNGETGVIGGPAHRLLQRMARSVHGYVQRGAGASDTQLRSLARDNRVHLHHERDGARLVIVGAYLTPRGEKYCEMLDKAEAERDRINALIGV